MALKDWKLQKKTRWQIMYYNVKENSRKLLIQSITNISGINKGVNWEVHDNYYVKDYFFKSKSQALKFAKSYMRTH